MPRINPYRRVPSDPTRWFSADEIARSRAHSRAMQRQGLAATLVTVGTLIAIVGWRLGPRVADALDLGWGAEVAIVVVASLLVPSIATVPTDVWKYRILRGSGSIHQVPRDYAVDELKNSVVAIVLFVPIGLAVWAAIRSTELWWLVGWAAFTAIMLAVAVLYPLVLMPAFNTFTPLTDDAMRDRIRRLGREAGVRVTGVFVMDASRRTRADNAFLAGAGPTRRVVLYDNVLARPTAQIEAILAHEISHWRRHHASIRYAANMVVYLAGFWATAAVAGAGAVMRWAGVTTLGDPGAVPLVLGVLVTLTTAAHSASAWLSRAHERQADLDALEFTRDPDAFIEVMKGLHLTGLADLTPTWWHRVRAGHPPAAERLQLAELWRASRTVAVLFTDIADSTAMVEQLGDRAWFELLQDHNEMVRRQLQAHGGEEIDTAGDGFLAVFEDAGAALLCAIAVQRDLDAHNALHADRTLRVRMGVHVGEVIRRARHVAGREVHVAARIAGCAGGGEILVSATVHDLLSGSHRFTFGGRRTAELKGLTGAHELVTVEWRETALADA